MPISSVYNIAYLEYDITYTYGNEVDNIIATFNSVAFHTKDLTENPRKETRMKLYKPMSALRVL